MVKFIIARGGLEILRADKWETQLSTEWLRQIQFVNDTEKEQNHLPRFTARPSGFATAPRRSRAEVRTTNESPILQTSRQARIPQRVTVPRVKGWRDSHLVRDRRRGLVRSARGRGRSSGASPTATEEDDGRRPRVFWRSELEQANAGEGEWG